MKFLRCAAHIVSILAPLTLMACALSAASQQVTDKSNQPENASAVTRQEYEKDKRIATDALDSIRRDIADNEKKRTQQEHAWIFGDAAPLWSNWLIFLVAGSAAVAAVCTLRSINSQTRSIRRQTRATLQIVRQTDRHFKIGHQQWLTVTDWSSRLHALDAPHSVWAGHIWIRVTNDTPLLIKRLISVECFIESDSNYRKISWYQNPIGPSNFYDVPGFTFIFSTDQRERFKSENVFVGIVGRLTFIDAMGDTQLQYFGRSCQLHRSKETIFNSLDGDLELMWSRKEDIERQESEALEEARRSDKAKRNEP